MNIHVELMRSTDGPDVVEALAAQGVEANLRKGSCELTVSADDVVVVEHVLEEWAAENGLPFVAYVVDDHRLVLAPPPS